MSNTLATQSGCFNNPKLQSVATTNDAGQVSSVSFAYDQYNNVTAKKFDWGGVTLLRETQNSYVTTPAYTALNLVRLPSETKVLNGAGVLSSDTTYQYDQGNMANCANIIGHDNANYAGQGTRGNATTVSQFLNSTSAWLNTTLAYDIAGNLVVITDANGRASSLSYVDAYPTAAVNSYAHVTTLTNALNQAQTWT